MFGMIKKIPVSLVAAFPVLAFCGCMQLSQQPRGTEDYYMTVRFTSPTQGEIHRIQISVQPDRPFWVRTQDKADNEYLVSGVLRHKQGGRFQFDPIKLELRLASGLDGFSGSDRREVSLGEETGGGGIQGYGESVTVTKR
jgi:hypothetical protein